VALTVAAPSVTAATIAFRRGGADLRCQTRPSGRALVRRLLTERPASDRNGCWPLGSTVDAGSGVLGRSSRRSSQSGSVVSRHTAVAGFAAVHADRHPGAQPESAKHARRLRARADGGHPTRKTVRCGRGDRTS
jgi:hypothetical protein